MGEFIVDLRQQSGVKRVLVVRLRTAFRNWFSGDIDLDRFQRQARRAPDVAP